MDLLKDFQDWTNKLNDNKHHFISHVLATFAASDGIVNENLVERFSNEVQAAKARSAFMASRSRWRTSTSKLTPFSLTHTSRSLPGEYPFDAVETIPCVKHKADWAMRWISDQKPTFAAVEGIFFSGSFASIFWLKKWGLIPGLTFSHRLRLPAL
jgi:ribonucleoside-diphosphate reductase subunit M2